MSEFEQDPIRLPDPPPSDVVPILHRQALSPRERLLTLNAAVGRTESVFTPAEVAVDAVGYPVGMGEADLRHRVFASAVVMERELRAAGVRRDEVPNLRVLDGVGRLV